MFPIIQFQLELFRRWFRGLHCLQSENADTSLLWIREVSHSLKVNNLRMASLFWLL